MRRLRVAEEPVPDQVDHVVDRVEVGQGLERLGQQRRRVEDAAEEDQRLQDELLGNRDVVELLGADADQDAELGEEEADEEEPRDQDEDVLDGQVDEDRSGDEREHSDDAAAGEAAEREGGEQLRRRGGRGELILDRALELLLEDRRGVVRERVHRPGHHDQAGDHEDDVVEAVQRVDAAAERRAEDRDVEEGLEQRRADRLLLDLHEAVHLPAPEGQKRIWAVLTAAPPRLLPRRSPARARARPRARRRGRCRPPTFERDSSRRPTSDR